MIKTQKIDYLDGDVVLEGYYAYDDAINHNLPAVLVAHDWSGRNDFACQRAERLAELGYLGFALDMYGKGKIGNTKEEKTALMQPLVQHREKLQQRINAAFETVKSLEKVNPHRIGAIGFCFGGLCVLDLARSGAEVKGVVTFHGTLNAPENMPSHPIKAKILVLHGFSDPMVKPEQVLAFCKEMTDANVDWEVDMYGHTMHGFTNPQANDPAFGTVYDKKADARSWIAMEAFFKEIFG